MKKVPGSALSGFQSGETTLEDEEAVLLMQWRALNNLPKNRG